MQCVCSCMNLWLLLPLPAVQLRNGLGHWFQTSSDQQFQSTASWKDLGGSPEAAAYLELEDQKVKQVVPRPGRLVSQPLSTAVLGKTERGLHDARPLRGIPAALQRKTGRRVRYAKGL